MNSSQFSHRTHVRSLVAFDKETHTFAFITHMHVNFYGLCRGVDDTYIYMYWRRRNFP